MVPSIDMLLYYLIRKWVQCSEGATPIDRKFSNKSWRIAAATKWYVCRS